MEGTPSSAHDAVYHAVPCTGLAFRMRCNAALGHARALSYPRTVLPCCALHVQGRLALVPHQACLHTHTPCLGLLKTVYLYAVDSPDSVPICHGLE